MAPSPTEFNQLNPNTKIMNTTKLTTALALVSSLATSHAAFTLLDDFESYTPGAISPQTSNWSHDTSITGGDGTVGSASGNQYLIQGSTTNAHTVFNNGTTLLADNATGTYFFRALMPTGGSHQGTSPSAREGFTNGWSDGGAIIRLGGIDPGTNIYGYDEGTGASGGYPLLTGATVANEWYNFWIVLNNSGVEGARSYDVYIQRDGDATFDTQQQVGNDLLYRVDGNTQIGSIESIFFRSANDGVEAYFDDIYFDGGGANLANPVPEPSIMLLGTIGVLGLLRRRR